MKAGIFTALVLSGAVSMAGASAAQATARPHASINCTTGDGGFCGGQDLEKDGLALTSTGTWKGAFLQVRPASDSVRQDFYQFNPDGNGSNAKSFEAAPAGVRSHLCVSDPSAKRRTKLRLRPCNASDFQKWVAVGPDANGYFEWINVATHLAMTDPAGGPEFTRLEGRPAVSPGPKFAPYQAWQFDALARPHSHRPLG